MLHVASKNSWEKTILCRAIVIHVLCAQKVLFRCVVMATWRQIVPPKFLQPCRRNNAFWANPTPPSFLHPREGMLEGDPRRKLWQCHPRAGAPPPLTTCERALTTQAQPPHEPSWLASAALAQEAQVAAPTPILHDNNNIKGIREMGHHPALYVPWNRRTRSEGGARDRGAVLAEVEEPRGKLQSVPGKVQGWEAKLAYCLGAWGCVRGASEKVLERRHLFKEAKRAVQGM